MCFSLYSNTTNRPWWKLQQGKLLGIPWTLMIKQRFKKIPIPSHVEEKRSTNELLCSYKGIIAFTKVYISKCKISPIRLYHDHIIKIFKLRLWIRLASPPPILFWLITFFIWPPKICFNNLGLRLVATPWKMFKFRF